MFLLAGTGRSSRLRERAIVRVGGRSLGLGLGRSHLQAVVSEGGSEVRGEFSSDIAGNERVLAQRRVRQIVGRGEERSDTHVQRAKPTGDNVSGRRCSSSDLSRLGTESSESGLLGRWRVASLGRFETEPTDGESKSSR